MFNYSKAFFFCQDASVDTSLTNQLLSLMKRSKALRFYGLMGKRSGLQLICVQKTKCFNFFFTKYKYVTS